jgi:hypothetical protein
MNKELEAYEGELHQLREDVARYKKGYEAAMRIIKPVFPDKFPDTYFICGEIGEKDNNNMPKKLLVCPAYGVDFSYVYEYTEQTIGPEW